MRYQSMDILIFDHRRQFASIERLLGNDLYDNFIFRGNSVQKGCHAISSDQTRKGLRFNAAHPSDLAHISRRHNTSRGVPWLVFHYETELFSSSCSTIELPALRGSAQDTEGMSGTFTAESDRIPLEMHSDREGRDTEHRISLWYQNSKI
jgi:hypothetical protein